MALFPERGVEARRPADEKGRQVGGWVRRSTTRAGVGRGDGRGPSSVEGRRDRGERVASARSPRAVETRRCRPAVGSRRSAAVSYRSDTAPSADCRGRHGPASPVSMARRLPWAVDSDRRTARRRWRGLSPVTRRRRAPGSARRRRRAGRKARRWRANCRNGAQTVCGCAGPRSPNPIPVWSFWPRSSLGHNQEQPTRCHGGTRRSDGPIGRLGPYPIPLRQHCSSNTCAMQQTRRSNEPNRVKHR